MSGFVAELNIGLMSNVPGQLEVSPASRFHARRVLESAGYVEYFQVKRVMYSREGAPEEVVEPTIVARVWVNRIDMGMWSDLLCQLALDMQQDCIAWYSPRREAGELVGPKSMDWGPFNIKYFHRPGR